MRNMMLAVLTVGLVLGTCGGAPAMMMTETIEGRYYPESSTPTLDKALEQIGNSAGRVHAYRQIWSEIGSTELLYFQGDTKAFNVFLERYSKLDYPPLTLTLMKEDSEHKPVLRVGKPGNGCDDKPVEMQEIRYDWELSHYLPGSKGGRESVYLVLWPGKVQFDKVRVPGNIEVKRYQWPKTSGEAPAKP